MKVAVAGGRGMLGQAFGRVRLEEHEIMELGRNEMDVTRATEVEHTLRQLKPDVLVNCSGFTDVDGCETEPNRAFLVNGFAVGVLARACLEHAVRLVHVSSDYVFNGKKGTPYDEADLACPANVYGLSKLKGEEEIQSILDHFLIVRGQWLYGPKGRHFVRSFLTLCESQREIGIVADQVGCPTLTLDLARGILKLVEKRVEGIVHLSSRGEVSWFEFACAILEEKGLRGRRVKPISSQMISRPAARPSYSVLSTELAGKRWGVVLPPWREALRSYLSGEA
jgi:dTDP-4-dehydrorhamnose reductase